MVPFRAHLSIATAALVLRRARGGRGDHRRFRGRRRQRGGRLPRLRLRLHPALRPADVGRPQNWVALGVYAVVMLLVARVVANLESARSEAQRRTAEARRLFELSELLVEDRSVEDLLKTIVRAVGTVFDVPGVALLVPEGGRLEIAASAGEALSAEELGQLDPRPACRSAWAPARAAPDGMQTVALSAVGRPVGILAMRGMPGLGGRPGPAPHLRQPRRPGPRAGPAARAGPALGAARGGRPAAARPDGRGLPRPAHPAGHHEGGLLDPARPGRSRSPTPTPDELYGLIDVETDRLTRLVTSLLDMTRIDAGVLEVRRGPARSLDLVDEARRRPPVDARRPPGRGRRSPTTCPTSTSTTS